MVSCNPGSNQLAKKNPMFLRNGYFFRDIQIIIPVPHLITLYKWAIQMVDKENIVSQV